MIRILDFIFSIIGLILVVPFFVIISLMIKFDDGGPVFYRGNRLGKNKKTFFILKFRTMSMDTNSSQLMITAHDDPRITNLGRWLRKYKIDEFPQFINIFLGEMSFVGPRPEFSDIIDTYPEYERNIILSVKPGLTDYASLRFHDEEKLLTVNNEPENVYSTNILDEKIKLQVQCIEDNSVLNYLNVLLSTIILLVRSRSGN